tara:strand:+ start:3230 stop:4189 length:960 start_codon:yes stop_codon:yes gene_type:complete
MTFKSMQHRPLVTFAMFTYNQEQYIIDAVNSALAQNYEPLEIIFSDDCSNDTTFLKMDKIVSEYQGRHSVVLRQNSSNLGLAAHVNAVLAEARGEIILFAAGDDISQSERCAISVNLLEKFPLAAEALVAANVIDGEGNGLQIKRHANGPDRVQTFNDLLSSQYQTFGAGRAIRRRVYDVFGDLNDTCPTEDTPYLLRSMISGGSILSDSVGVQYRVHGKNMSGAFSMAKMNIDQIYSQYRSDFKRAKQLGLVTDLEIASLNNWIKLDLQFRIIKAKMAFKRHTSFTECLTTWKISKFTIKDRLKCLALFIFGKRNELT